MSSASRNQDRARLEYQLLTAEYQQLLGSLQGRSPFLRRFTGWPDVLDFMGSGSTPNPEKDEVLRAILQTHAEGDDTRRWTVLLVIFWPRLEVILRWKRSWDREPDQLWQAILVTFLEAVRRIDVARRPERIARKLLNDTLHHLHENYRRQWRREAIETATDPETLGRLAGQSDGFDFDAFDLRERGERTIRRLGEHVRAGRITDADYFLIIGTRLYGRSVADYARGVDLDYQVLKKRRQRAEAVLRRYEDRSS